ncbi:SprT family zinc-dependent metalloprotease [Coraliomargarita algicola]|uniref:SprT family zinc-dependent metalloprotease n=1 Tax=Coraliomargarita algicola TaxID=3092156 RepID=A0ABZ0RHW2_9BACT|nr:SprT family zinc-dependent metalloprotease [Coraliomargarita sp. J2-16]WPJ95771.1 SprT family zinc-dependent metalloprotease [Coraliomargarita sp. J2-16]
MEFLSASGRRVPVEVCRRKGTRHLRLRLGHQNQVVASVPWHISDRGVAKFIATQRDWIDAQLAKVPKVSTLSDWLERHPQMSASGDVFQIRIESSTRAKADYCFDGGASVLVLRLPVAEECALLALTRRFAKDALVCRVAYQAKRLDLEYSGLSVRDQSSRWGSCSSRRGISLNWRLVLLRPELQDYVILHELAHLSEMNHGPRFWALLDSYDPQRVTHEAALDAIGSELMRVGRCCK